MTDPIRRSIDAFLALVGGGQCPTDAEEAALLDIVDDLAVAVRHAPAGEVTSDLDAPRQDYDSIRAGLKGRFQRCGLYQSPALFESEEDPQLLTGDAIDDIVDIAVDLAEVVWLWDNAGQDEALWQLHHGFRSHWGDHLRGLQWYLHAVTAADNRVAGSL